MAFVGNTILDFRFCRSFAVDSFPGIKEPLAREGFHATPFNAGNPRTGVAPQVEEVALLQCVGLFPRQTAPAAKWRDFGLGNAC